MEKEGRIKPKSVCNVLIVSDHLGHEQDKIHGATRYFLDVLPRLHQSPFLNLSVVFLRGTHAMAEKLIKDGVRPIFLDRSKHDARAVIDIIRLIRTLDIHLVHCSGMKGILTGRMACRITRIPCIDHLHDMLPQGFPIKKLMQFSKHWSRQTLAISNAVASFAANDFKIAPSAIITLHNGVVLDAYRAPRQPEDERQLRQELGIPGDAMVVAAIGRLHAVKGFSDCIEILKRLQDIDVWLMIVGDGPEKTFLQHQAKNLPVVFTGQRTDIPDVLRLASLMLMPSRNEGLGLSAIEAQAAGVPVLAYATGGLKEVIAHNQTGILIPRGDINGLLQATRDLLTNTPKRAQFSQNAKLRAQSFDIQRHIDTLLSVYRGIACDVATNLKPNYHSH